MIAVLCDIRSIHNVGSIFRTADAAGVEKLYLCGITPSPLDRFGHARMDFVKVSLGAEDSVPWEKIPSVTELIQKLKKDVFTIVCLEQTAQSIPHTDKRMHMQKNIALIVGNEVRGLSEDVLKLSDYIIEIPMRGKKESLNVSVSFGIAVYELKKGAE